MTFTRNSWLILASLVTFLVALVLTILDTTVDQRLISGLLFGGLASFAAGHLP